MKSSSTERKDGDEVALLVGQYDPPSVDYSRAVEGILSTGSKHVWVCPLNSDNATHVRAMASILCMEISGNVSLCSVGLDLKTPFGKDVRLWCENKFNSNKFKVYFLGSEPQDSGTAIEFGNVVRMNDSLCLPKFIACQNDVRKKINSGGDERRSFTPMVWDYIVRHGLYRQGNSD